MSMIHVVAVITANPGMRQGVLEKFNAKHSNLNYPQKSLLRVYINNVSNATSLKEFITELILPEL